MYNVSALHGSSPDLRACPSITDDNCESPVGPSKGSFARSSYTSSHSLTRALTERRPASQASFIGSDRPSLKKALGREVSAFNSSAQGVQFTKEFGQLYDQILGDNGRGIRNMMLKEGIGDPLSAVYRLATANSVALLTGFKVPVANGSASNPNNPSDYRGIQETDGPLGVAFMALGCLQTKKPVSVICDKETQPLVEACLRALAGQKAVDAVRFLMYEAQGEHAQAAADAIADALAEADTDLLIPIETAGRNSEGIARSMGGIDISGYNPDYDTLIRTLSQQMNVAAIGDGGNEAGFGGTVTGVPPAANGKEMQAVTGADYSMPARVSNWGGVLFYVSLMRLAGVPKSQMPIVGQHNNAVREMLKAGAVDGCTKNTDENFEAGGLHTGVDGMSIEVNGQLYARCVDALSAEAIEFPLGRFPEWDKPVTVLMFDSSDGVFIAGKKLMRYLDAQLPGKKTYVMFGDHGNAPYGSKSPEQIERHVSEALTKMREFSDAPVVMACNTACIALDRMERNGIPVNDINLVKNSSRVIVTDPHSRVAVLATPAMANSGLFQTFIDQGLVASGKGKEVGVYGCPGWADIVNARDLHGPDQHKKTEAMKKIREKLAQLPLDLDAIYLCCTHYPALSREIVAIYDANRKAAGITSPFLVLDPMKRQAETAARVYKQGNFTDSSLQSDAPVLILTTGNLDQVREAARTLLDMTDNQFEVFSADFPVAANHAPQAGATSHVSPIDSQIDELFDAAKAHVQGIHVANLHVANLVQMCDTLLQEIAPLPPASTLRSLDHLVSRLAMFVDPDERAAVPQATRDLVTRILTQQIRPMVSELSLEGVPLRLSQFKDQLLRGIDGLCSAREVAEAELAG